MIVVPVVSVLLSVSKDNVRFTHLRHSLFPPIKTVMTKAPGTTGDTKTMQTDEEDKT